jgi:hypothetical protein
VWALAGQLPLLTHLEPAISLGGADWTDPSDACTAPDALLRRLRAFCPHPPLRLSQQQLAQCSQLTELRLHSGGLAAALAGGGGGGGGGGGAALAAPVLLRELRLLHVMYDDNMYDQARLQTHQGQPLEVAAPQLRQLVLVDPCGEV